MTQLLEQAYAQVVQLSETEQDRIATLILEFLADKAEWEKQFADSQDALATLAQEALAERHAGKTLPLDPETL